MGLAEQITASEIEPTTEGLIIKVVRRQHHIAWDRCSIKLAKADTKARLDAKLSPSGYGIHWPSLDEDLSVQGLLES